MAVARHGRPLRAAAGSADCRGEGPGGESGLTSLTAQHVVWSRLYRGEGSLSQKGRHPAALGGYRGRKPRAGARFVWHAV
jgi:hypothetical protein